jgi:pimeloyl-ACP methyl ester carboxylesterase
VSTPTSLALPDGVQRTGIQTSRGLFAALEALPAPGVCERETALLIPGYTGSKEDFLALLDQLASARRRVIAIDMRGQYQTAGIPDGYAADALGADIAAIARETGSRHLLGHSFGGLVAREAMLAAGAQGLAGDGIESFTLMSSGPSALTGARADDLKTLLATLGADGNLPVAEIWQTYLEPQAVAAGVPPAIVVFLRERMLSNDPIALVAMAKQLLTAPDRTDELARLRDIPMLVIYGENDNSWSPETQEDMARRLGARRVCIPGAVHSPNVEAPATTASALTSFWNEAEAICSARSRT